MSALLHRNGDSRIHEAIEDELRRSSRVTDAAHIVIEVADGIVTLTGEVPSAAEKRFAGLAAWSSPHVRWVQNDLVVARA